MKCPYCNQNHPDDYQFCPITGKSIRLLKACTNPQCSDNGKHILPEDSLFCPRCGRSLGKVNKSYEFNPRKSMSSVEDFRHGNIIIDGIILGRTSASELKKFPEKQSYNSHYFDSEYELMDGNVIADGGMSQERHNFILEISEQYDSHLLSKMGDKVYSFSISDCDKIPFLHELGLGLYKEEEDLIHIIESNGYVRIDPVVFRKEWVEKINKERAKVKNETAHFISNKPNAYGDYIDLSFDDETLRISVSWFREWTSYYDGVKHSL